MVKDKPNGLHVGDSGVLPGAGSNGGWGESCKGMRRSELGRGLPSDQRQPPFSSLFLVSDEESSRYSEESFFYVKKAF